MRLLRYHVDTSVWNFLLEKDRPERQAATERFFRQLDTLEMLAIVEVVTRESGRAPEPRRAELERLLKQYQPEMLEVTFGLWKQSMKRRKTSHLKSD